MVAYFELVSPVAYESPRTVAALKLFELSLNEKLNEYAYDAQVGSSWFLVWSQGFTRVLLLFVCLAISSITLGFLLLLCCRLPVFSFDPAATSCLIFFLPALLCEVCAFFFLFERELDVVRWPLVPRASRR